jgi:hypothetical protein
MRWLKSLGSSAAGNCSSSNRVSYRPQLETLELRQMLSIDPVVSLVGTDLNEDSPAMLPLAAVEQNIQDTWQATSTTTLTVSEDTGEKPQSKVWTNAGEWFAVLPNSSGTWIWRLEGSGWAPVLKLSSASGFHADVKATGNVTHVLLFDGGSTQLASVQYVAASRGYEFWSARPGLANLPLPGNSETATIDIDSLGRMWVCYENKSARTVEVRYSDNNYANWSGAITVASGIGSDDIAGLVAMGGGQIGVFWSSQPTSRFGFRTHSDNADPNSWNAAEVPAAQSAQSGMADDHLHLAAAADGTLYVAAKTSYDRSGAPEIILMVRRPNGSWDAAYEVSSLGTRPIIVINEQIDRLIVAYTQRDGGGDILYRESSTENISFAPSRVLISGSNNNVSSTKQSFTDELFILAGTGSKVKGTLLVGPVGGPPAPTNQAPLVSAGSDRSTLLGTPAALAGSASDDGQPAGSMSLLWSLVSGPGLAFFGNENQAATNVTFSAAGSYVLRLTATDGELASSDDVVVTVTSSAPANQPPQVSAGADLNGQSGAAISLAGTATDDGNPAGTLTVQWTVVSGPGSVSIANVNSANTTATFSAAGTYVLRLTGSDGALSANDEVSVVVTSPVTTGSDLVGFWNFKAGIGASYASRIGNQGSTQGGATVDAEGRLSLNGSNQRFVVPDVSDLHISQAITISAWIKPSVKGTQYLVKKAGEGSSDGFELSLSNDGKVFVRFNERSSGNTFRVSSTSSYPTNGSTWMHVAATYDGTTIRLYVNGQQQGSKAANFTIGQNNLPLSIGSGDGGYRSMRGALDEVLIADRALSAAEISQVHLGTFNATTPTPPPPPAPSTNQPPSVSAGSDRSGQTGAAIALAGTATDDGLPSGVLLSQWTVTSGPGAVTFANAASASTTATFGTAGTYVLRLTSSDGSLSASDEVSFVIASPPVISSGVVGRWKFEGGSTGDSSGRGNNGTLQSGAALGTGQNGGGLQIGASGQRMEVPDSASLDIAQAITIAAWIKPSTSGTQYVVNKAGKSSTDGFELSLSASGTVFVRFNENSSGNTYRVDSSTNYPTNGNTWMHVVATYDGTTIRLYINGQEQASKAASFTIGTNNLPLSIGSGEGGYRSMLGAIDDVLVADRALSTSEILSLYQGTF